MPGFVRAAAEARVPADGQVHVQRRGSLRVSPAVRFCTAPPIVDDALRARGVRGTGLVGLVEKLRSIGQPTHIGGSLRQAPLSRSCPPAGDNVIEQGFVILNGDGEPYRVVLAFWQGAAAWIGSIERAPGGPRPEIFNPYGTDPVYFEVEADTRRISETFLNNLSGAD